MALLTKREEICPRRAKQFRDVIPQAASDNKGGQISTGENLLGGFDWVANPIPQKLPNLNGRQGLKSLAYFISFSYF
jgi:hypothetical protein